ncbi:Swc5 protein [Candida orthopsilosis Co 90-125]|uniref:SWR1-complex protein 5 n=1 Tax=Candida orthopsilosis (strain 90-125) TaxID=1136231 RepID=H8XBC3_CANO9|nr:Swc5 protein [Candida orthopsilosis Co 90-125]CCG25372.1 Swc5 protein [Candida orthopsilosis Co 90-125]
MRSTASSTSTPIGESNTPTGNGDTKLTKEVTLNDKDIDDDDDADEEEEDEDYDPTKKEDAEATDDDDDADLGDDDGKIPDFSKIESSVSQVKTRSQRLHAKQQKQAKYIGNFETDSRGLVKETCSLDINSIFNDLKENKVDIHEELELETSQLNDSEAQKQQKEAEAVTANPTDGQQIRIQINYTFAGKLITESKLVDANSEEAKAYLNSTSSITSASNDIPNKRTEVKVIRQDPQTKENVELRIKLKRPSLIDKFIELNGNNKKMKLSTLEKSRLDWASFIDKRKIGDELKRHNRGGYLDKQEFLSRVDSKKDEIYQKAKEEERKRQFQLQGK